MDPRDTALTRSTVRVIRLTVSLSIAVFFTSAAAEALCAPSLVTSSQAHTYLNAFVDSLAYAKEASDLTDKGSASLMHGPTTEEGVGVWLLNVKLTGERYRCAAIILEPYTNSENEAVRTSAKAATFVYSRLIEIDREFVDEVVSRLDDRQTPKIGASLDRLTDLGSMKNQTWKMLLLATVGATHVAVLSPAKSDEHLRRLALTATERRQLLQALHRIFGPGVRGGLRAGQSALEGAAAALFEFLADMKWKSLDAK